MSLHIGNLSSRIRRDELARVFQRYGQCSIRIKDGYGFVVYEYPPNAEKALRALHKRNICGEPLTLSWSNKQPRQCNRLARAGRSYEPQHGRDSVKGRLGSNDRDYRTSMKQSDGINRRNDMHDKEVRYGDGDTKDNLGGERSGYRDDFLDEGGRFESGQVYNDRWAEQLHDQCTENGDKNDVEFERYEPYQSYDRKYDDGSYQMACRSGSSALRSPQKNTDRDNCNEVNLKHIHDAKFQVTCYRCGCSGHKMRNCPQESASRRKSNGLDYRHDDDISRRGSGGSEPGRLRSRSWERSSRDSNPKRLLKNDMKSSCLGKHQKTTKNGSSPLGDETDKSSKKHNGGNKRNRKEIGTLNRHDTKKARLSFSASLHSSSQSSGHVKRFRSQSRSRSISSKSHPLSSKSKSSSASHYSRSKSSKSRARSSSHTSLTALLGQPLPTSSCKAQLTLKGSSEIATTPESKAIMTGQLADGDNGLEDAKLENRLVAVSNENGVPPSIAEMEKGLSLQKDSEDHQIASSSLYEVTNPSTTQVEKGALDNGSFSQRSHEIGRLSSTSLLEEMNCPNSDKLMTEHVPIQVKNPDSDPLISSGISRSLSISSEELHVVLKHYYGHELQDENERHLPAEAYFGSARLWPWEVIYYRRSKKGPISIENYARRLDQNREFDIVDKYVRSSSGWGELTQ